MRKASPQDFTITVDGIGTFSMARKNFRDQMAIEAEYNRLTEGLDQITAVFSNLASAVAEIKVRMVSGPDGWRDLDALDPEDSETYAGILKIWEATRADDITFRKGVAVACEGSGAPA